MSQRKSSENVELEVTVVICTRNRGDLLRRVLGSLSRLKDIESLSWEVVVVDNGDPGVVSKVVEEFTDRLPIRWVPESTPGLSHARNKGVSEARGKYIVWTDDDVLVDPNWLSAYVNAFRAYPEAVAFGGQIEPVLDQPTPGWFEANKDLLADLMAKREFEQQPLSVEQDILPFGANYAVRAEEQKAVQYESKLGVSPTMMRSGEESQVISHILTTGHGGRWVSGSKVFHVIPSERQSKSYIIKYYKGQGETHAFLNEHGMAWSADHELPKNSPILFGAPLWAWRRALKSGLCCAAGRLMQGSRFEVRWLTYHGFNLGVLNYWRTAR